MPNDTALDILWNTMEQDLNRRCSSVGAGVMGYSLCDLTTGKTAKFQEQVVFPTASTIKIAILLAVATKVHAGQLDWQSRYNTAGLPKVGGSGILSLLRDPVELSLWDLSSLMIALSDNDATNACIDLAGMDYVNSLLSSLGLKKTLLRRKMMDGEAVLRGDENVSTPEELMKLVSMIEKRDGIPDAVCKDVLTILSLEKDGAFTQGLPPHVKRANKPGGLDHVAVDAGLIYLRDRTVALGVMACFVEEKPTETVADLIRTAYRYLNLISECTEYGRA
ncbi:MAG TPA: serine hydrolase [Firmicutes bacterium]|nr:serine hydrolase [Candidatus Fermentithermobacillaceae bacterium]